MKNIIIAIVGLMMLSSCAATLPDVTPKEEAVEKDFKHLEGAKWKGSFASTAYRMSYAVIGIQRVAGNRIQIFYQWNFTGPDEPMDKVTIPSQIENDGTFVLDGALYSRASY